MLTKLNSKKIYIAPYNDRAIKLDNFLKKNLLIYNSLGFIDSYKIGSNIIHPKELKNYSYDYIIVLNSLYQDEIYHLLKNIFNIQSEKILYSIAENYKYVFTKAFKQKKVLCFGTCQMNHLANILSQYTMKYSIKYITNYGPFFNIQEVYKKMEQADIIIYQALSEKRC